MFEVRGEILTVPAKKGDIRNLTRTPGVHERYPAWSPDGQRIAYFSDASGEYELVLADQTGLEEKNVISLGKQTLLLYARSGRPTAQKSPTPTRRSTCTTSTWRQQTPVLVDTDTYDHPERSLNPAWSPDSKWIAYTKRLETHIRAVFLYELETRRVPPGHRWLERRHVCLL